MSKRILISPLNWGLGHATRCIPIINALIANNFEPIIASDGNSLTLLQKEFQNLKFIELPSYNIKYAKKGSHLKLKLLKDAPMILKAIKTEHKVIQNLVNDNAIDGIISDNRFGVYNKNVPSVFLTHQLNIISGNTTWLSTKIHQSLVKNFDEYWVPDFEGKHNLSGVLGHPENYKITTKYIGPLSRFTKTKLSKKYDLMVLLSGPEPQRSMLEEKLLSELENHKGNVIFIKGVLEPNQQIAKRNNLTIINYVTSSELEKFINESELILSRSGYTTIMDLAKMEKKAFFIPTPGQYEQIYLAKKLKKEGIAPYALQDEFSLDKLDEVIQFEGFKNLENNINYEALFGLFKRE